MLASHRVYQTTCSTKTVILCVLSTVFTAPEYYGFIVANVWNNRFISVYFLSQIKKKYMISDKFLENLS